MNASMHWVVVLNWFGREDTIECVRSLVEHSPDVATLVVDNGSFDGALDDVTARWPDVKVLQLDQNYGFAGGMNRGIEYAIDRFGAEVITVLNNDTLVPADTMTRARELAETGAAVSPTISYLDDPDRVWFGGGALDLRLGYAYHLPEQQLPGCVAGVRQTEMMTGCCVTARSETWRKIGLFDERFFLNFEDSEWSLRARAVGVPLVVACDARILHAVSASFTRSGSRLGAFYFLRNGMLFSRLAGANPLARLRFLRRFGLPGIARGPIAERARAAVLVIAATTAYLTRSFGRAPRVVAWIAR